MRLTLGWTAGEHSKSRCLQCSNNLFLISDNKVDKATAQKSNKRTRKHKTTAVSNGLSTIICRHAWDHAPCILPIEAGLTSSSQNQLTIYFVTSRQYRLGIAKLKNVFRSFLTYSKNLLRNFKNFLFSQISTDSLTTPSLTDAFRHDNCYSKKLDFFIVQCCFVWRCAFLPTTAVPMLASWSYQSSPFFSFVLYSFLPGVGEVKFGDSYHKTCPYV